MFAKLCLINLIGAHFLLAARADEPRVEDKDLPRIPPTEPARALSTFQIKQGFRIELVAAEPLVVDPIAMSFDEDGRLFVIEMRDYSERRDERLGRVRMLVDTDGDGRFDKSTVFADGLPWPTAVFCSSGGVFVGSTPDIYFFKDTNGDGVADVKETIFTGFASDYAPYQTNRLNVQALMNSFNWGLDNRIHGATSLSGGKVTSLKGSQSSPLDLRGHDFSFDPRSFILTPESAGGQHGMSFDNHGRKYICSNSAHLRLDVYAERYAGRNPFYAMPNPAVDIAADGPAAEVYRLSPDEPWRVIRTKWRVAGLVPGPVEGGGRPSGYFTGATGVTIYRGNAWPEEFAGDAFIADCGSNLIHRKKLRADGVSLVGERPLDEQKTEFLASTDNWFRPVQMANAPDGALYIADMYREIIEHPWSLPQSIKEHLDLNSGNDRGRIYRIVPEHFQQPKLPHFSSVHSAELVAALESANGWHRDTAARLIYERQDKEALPALNTLFKQSRSPLARMHALLALDGLQAVTESHLLAALNDSDSWVRTSAVRLSETLLADGRESETLWKALSERATDPDVNVRYQLAFCLGATSRPQRLQALAGMARQDANDPWIRAAVLSSLATGAEEVLGALMSTPDAASNGGIRELIAELATSIGSRKQPGTVAIVAAQSVTAPDDRMQFLVLRNLAEGLKRAGGLLDEIRSKPGVDAIFTRASLALSSPTTLESTRIEAVKLLGQSSYAEARTNLIQLLSPGESQSMVLEAIRALAQFKDQDAAQELIARWSSFTPRARQEAMTMLLSRPDRITLLLQALQDGVIQRSELSASQIQFLRQHGNEQIRKTTEELFGASFKGPRQTIVDRYSPSLQLSGKAEHGRELYLTRCSACHRLAGSGYAVGPDLVSVRSNGREKLLINILDPNREVSPNFLSYSIETKNGDSYIGLIAAETPNSVTLRRPNNEENTLLRSNIVAIKSQGQSLMPEALEEGLTTQDMADLLEYVSTVQ